MKTIELIRFTGEMTEQEIDGEITEIPVTEVVKEYTCEDGEEDSLLFRAKLTAEIYSRDKDGDFEARIKA